MGLLARAGSEHAKTVEIPGLATNSLDRLEKLLGEPTIHRRHRLYLVLQALATLPVRLHRMPLMNQAV